MYQSSEHTIFYQDDGLPVHYDPISLQFTEISSVHEKVLADFSDSIDDVNKVTATYDNEQLEAFDELVEAGLIGKPQENKSSLQESFCPNIVAFRIVLTEKCNLRCAECFVTKNNQKLTTASLDQLDKTADEIIRYSKSKQTMVHFFGGEPLIRFDYIKHLVERFNVEAKIKPNYSITTNATLVTKEVAKFFYENSFRIAISLDGDKELHDLLRPDAIGQGSYAKVMESYKLFRQSGNEPSLIITPHPKRLAELEKAFPKMLSDFKPKAVTINIPFDYENLAWSVDGKVFANFIINATEICRNCGVRVSSALSPILAAISNQTPRNSPCSMFDDDVMVSIRTDGKMSFCSQKWHDDMVQKLPSPEETIVVKLAHQKKCESCIARTICGGPCPAYQIITKQNVDNNKCVFMHSILAEIVKHLEWFEENEDS